MTRKYGDVRRFKKMKLYGIRPRDTRSDEYGFNLKKVLSINFRGDVTMFPLNLNQS